MSRSNNSPGRSKLSNPAWPILIALLSLAPTGLSAQDDLAQSVVLIGSASQSYDYAMPWKQQSMRQQTGSGLVIEGKLILTNAHNVSDSKYIEVKKHNHARPWPAVVEFLAHDCDLALLSVRDELFFDDMVALELGGLPQVNTTVSTYGFPVGGRHISVTEGVVSRIQMDTYSHTGADQHLVIQTDAAINPGNSGGPVIQQGKVFGVAFQGLRQADNIGYMIPTTVIRHFLEDVRDGRYDGFGSLGFSYFPGLHSESYKDYLKVPTDKSGLVVTGTLMHSSVEEILQPGDVVTAIDQYDIDNDAMVWIDGLRLNMAEVIERKQIGESVSLSFYRDGQKHQEQVQIRLNRGILELSRQYDRQPEYVVYAGLTFVPLTRNYLETWGRNWFKDIPHTLRYLLSLSDQINTDRHRKHYVVLSEILSDRVNAYCGEFENHVVESINTVPIWEPADIYTAVRQSSDGSCTIRFIGLDRPLILDATAAAERHEVILAGYHIPTDSHLEGKQ